MTNREKTIMIDALRTKHQLSELLATVGMAKSSYFYHEKALNRPDKYMSLRKEVIEVFSNNRRVYDYRRIHAVLKKQGITCSEKVTRRLMYQEHLVAHGKKKRK